MNRTALSSARGGRIQFLGARRWLVVAALAFALSGCCFQVYKDVFVHLVKNAKSVVQVVEKVLSHQYFTAVSDVFKIVSSINTSCPPKALKPEVLNKLPIELDFNLLHEYRDARGEVQVISIDPVKAEEVQTEDDINKLHGVSESDNYKFVFAGHQELYVYVFQIDSTGEVGWQFPKMVNTPQGQIQINPRQDSQGVNPVPAEKVMRVPESDDDWFYLNEHGRNGVENFFMIASKSRQIELEEALAKACEAAKQERAANPKVFTETLIKLPLIVPSGQSGLSNDAGTTSGNAMQVKTESGFVKYSPQTFNATDTTVVITRSFLHLPPRATK